MRWANLTRYEPKGAAAIGKAKRPTSVAAGGAAKKQRKAGNVLLQIKTRNLRAQGPGAMIAPPFEPHFGPHLAPTSATFSASLGGEGTQGKSKAIERGMGLGGGGELAEFRGMGGGRWGVAMGGDGPWAHGLRWLWDSGSDLEHSCFRLYLKGKEDTATQAVENLKQLASPNDKTLKEAVTDWPTTFANSVLGPFLIIKQFKKDVAPIPAALMGATRIAFRWMWCEQCTVSTVKNWGGCRKHITDFMIGAHPDIFSAHALQALPLGSNGSNDVGDAFSLEQFMQRWKREDDLSAFESVQTSTEPETIEKQAGIGEARKFRRIFHDESTMLALTIFANKCGLSKDWGWEMLPEVRSIVTKCSSGVVNEALPEMTSTDKISQLAGILSNELEPILRQEFFVFTRLAIKFVYEPHKKQEEAAASQGIAGQKKAAPTSTDETCDAIFGDIAGANRFMMLPLRISCYVFSRLLGTGSTLSESAVLSSSFTAGPSALLDQTAQVVIKLLKNGVLWKQFWGDVILCKGPDEIKKCVEKFENLLKEADGVKGEDDGEAFDPLVVRSDAGPAWKWIADTCSGLIPGALGSPSAFRVVISAVQNFLCNQFSPGLSSDRADSGIHSIYQIAGEGEVFYAKRLQVSFRLTFYGEVSGGHQLWQRGLS